jgi:hypothetical protein
MLLLLTQAASAAVSAIAVAQLPPATARRPVADTHTCCRGLGPGKMCPMHKAAPRSFGATGTSDTSCRLSSGCAPKAIALTSISTTWSLPSVAYRAEIDLAASTATIDRVDAAPSWEPSPPLHPPRA